MQGLFKRTLLRPLLAAALLATFIMPKAALSSDGFGSALSGDLGKLRGDYSRFYLDGVDMLRLGGALAAAGLLANTAMDGNIQDYYRGHLRSGTTDGISDAFRLPGEIFLAVPIVLGTRLLLPDGPAGEWAGRTLRAYLLGGPLGLFLQRATGGARPEEGPSDWDPFRGDNGLSGHAFIGAVPFLAAARMQKSAHARWTLYGLSALAGLSRINDDKHYASQVFLGWYLAYLSVRTIEGGGEGGRASALIPAVIDGKVPGLVCSRAF